MSTPGDSPSVPAPRKVVVLFRATGDAPIMKQSKFKITGTEKFAKVIDFLRKQLHRETLVSCTLSSLLKFRGLRSGNFWFSFCITPSIHHSLLSDFKRPAWLCTF
ncbi:hypothetical protein M758_4G015300 [Ceratodon purpureus]|nr:hypothetical protein M758_4G015300 [Ceratodon purpureus]